jgi:exocyst complex component 3
VDNHDFLRDLAVMRVNVARTIADAEAIMALPEEAAAAMRLLDSDERNLLKCWEAVTALAARAAPARVALEAGAYTRSLLSST